MSWVVQLWLAVAQVVAVVVNVALATVVVVVVPAEMEVAADVVVVVTAILLMVRPLRNNYCKKELKDASFLRKSASFIKML